MFLICEHLKSSTASLANSLTLCRKCTFHLIEFLMSEEMQFDEITALLLSI